MNISGPTKDTPSGWDLSYDPETGTVDFRWPGGGVVCELRDVPAFHLEAMAREKELLGEAEKMREGIREVEPTPQTPKGWHCVFNPQERTLVFWGPSPAHGESGPCVVINDF